MRNPPQVDFISRKNLDFMDHSIMNEGHRKFDLVLAKALARLDRLDEKTGVAAPKKRPLNERPIMPSPVSWKGI